MANIVVDMSPWIYASYFTLYDKISWWMVWGVLNSLLTVIDEEHPTTIALIWGSKYIDKRRMYPQYRTGRSVKIDFDQKQYQRLHELFTALGVCQLQLDGLEADQVLAAYVNSLNDCVIISDDKDFFQLLSDIKFLKGPRRGTWDGRRVMKEFNLKSPKMFADWQALTGDRADNIPRVVPTNRDAALLLNSKGYLNQWAFRTPPDFANVPSRLAQRISSNLRQLQTNYLLTNLQDERLTESMIIPSKLDLDFAKDKLQKMQMNLFLRKFDKFAALSQTNLAVKREMVGLKHVRTG